ncbi:MAG: trypsin-like peptidase domain-containing protein [Chloroflexota bacterium]
MKRNAIKIAAISLILAITLILSAGCSYIRITTSPSTPSVTTTPAPATTPASATTPAVTPINPVWTPPAVSSQSQPLPNIADVVALVKPSVVAINTEIVSTDIFNRPFSQEGAGSGWILDKNGIIVTNNHVVEGATSITVTLDDGRTFKVDPKSVSTDQLNDLAVLKIDAQNLPALKIGDSAKMRVGDWVVAIGNALGQGIRATQGIVSRQGVSLSLDQGQTLYDLIETTAAINPGNSGGPLVNLAGEVIGITSAKVASVGVEGMGYAISSNTAIPIIEALVSNGYVVRPYLGVTLYTVDQFAVMRYNLATDTGILITQIAAGSPADTAGLKVRDVIVAIDGKEMTTADDLIQVLRNAKIGQVISLTYWRGNAKNTTSATLVESPPP